MGEETQTISETHPTQLSFFTPTQWFSLFTDVIDSGLMASMNQRCKATSAVMLSIKRHEFEQLFKDRSNITKKGLIPAVSVLSKDSGFKSATVSKALKILEEEGIIEEDEKTKGIKNTGRGRLYKYKDKINVYASKTNPKKKDERESIGHILLDYHPNKMNEMIRQIEREMSLMNQNGMAPSNSPNITFVVNQNFFHQTIEPGGTGNQNQHNNQKYGNLTAISAEEAERIRDQSWNELSKNAIGMKEMREIEETLQKRLKAGGLDPTASKNGKKSK